MKYWKDLQLGLEDNTPSSKLKSKLDFQYTVTADKGAYCVQTQGK